MQTVDLKSVFAQTKAVLRKSWLPLFILNVLPGLLYIARVLSYTSIQAAIYYTTLWAVQVVLGCFAAAAIMAILRSGGSLTWQQAIAQVKDGVMKIIMPAVVVVAVTAVLAGINVLTPQALYVVYVMAPLFVLAGGKAGLTQIQKDLMANQGKWLVLAIHGLVFGVVVYYLNLTILRLLYQIVMSNLVIALYFTAYFSAAWTFAFAYFSVLYRAVMSPSSAPKVM